MKKIRDFFNQGGLMLFILGRVLAGIPIVIALSLLVFLATQALPGDAAVAYLANSATPERLAAIREQLNLDDPIMVQYFSWASGVVQLDFGQTLTGEVSVSGLLGERIQHLFQSLLLPYFLSFCWLQMSFRSFLLSPLLNRGHLPGQTQSP